MNVITSVTEKLSNPLIGTEDLKEMVRNLAVVASGILQSVGFMSEQYDRLVKAQTQYFNENKDLRRENKHLKDQCVELKHQYDELLQYGYRDNIEIKNFPYANGENCVDIIKKIGHAVGVSIDDTDISTAHRTGRPRDDGFPPNLVARFVRRDKRTALVTACRRKKPKTSDIGPSYVSQPFYVSDHLTKEKKKLFSLANNLKKAKHWKFIWTTNCQILLRKNEGTSAIRINNEEDLQKIV